MAFNHIHYDKNSQYGSKLSEFLRLMEIADDQQRDVRFLIFNMIDGDGSNISHFDEVVRRLGVGDGVVNDTNRTSARNMWLEIDSAYSKTSGDGSVSSVRSARDQLMDKLRS